MHRVVVISALFFTLAWVGAEDIAYVTDLPIYDALAPCAAKAVSSAIGAQSYSQSCPSSVTELQSCICTKRHDEVAKSISSYVDWNCGWMSSYPASRDQSSASTVLAAYCDQETTTTFPAPAHPVSSYIFELDHYSELARCASSMLSWVVQSNTNNACPPLPTDFAPCACDTVKNSASITNEIKSKIEDACNSNTADVSTAQAFFAAYCKMNEGTTSLPTATNPPGDMTYFISEMSQYQSLSSCAQSAIISAINPLTYNYCPSMGPQEMASCVCIKNKMSRYVSSSMSAGVRYKCQTQVLDNLNSASDVFDLYCSAARGEVTEDVYVTASHTGARATGGAANDNDSGHHGPSAGVIAGAVVGSVVGFLVVCMAMCYLKRRGRQRYLNKPADNIALQNSGQPEASEEVAASQDISHGNSIAGDVILPMDVNETSAPPPYEPVLHGKMYNGKGN